MAISQEILDLHRSLTVIDIHCHPLLPMYLFGRKFYRGQNSSGPEFDLLKLLTQMGTDFERLAKGGVGAIWSSAYVPEHGLLDTCFLLHLAEPLLQHSHEITTSDPYLVADSMLLEMNAQVADAATQGANVGQPRNFGQLEFLLPNEGVIVLHALEGAHMLGRGLGSLDEYIRRLDHFIERGVVSITLGHFFENDITPSVNGFAPHILKTGCFDVPHDPLRGLTNIGEEVVRHMLERGVIVDLNHATPATRDRVFAINKSMGNKRPLVFTHTGVREFVPRELLTPDEFEIRQVAACGGVIGLISMPYWLNGDDNRKEGLDLIVQTAAYIKRIVGIDHVAIGTDFDGFTNPCSDFYDATMFPALTEALINGGFTDDEVRAVMGGNALRVMKDGWGGANIV